MDLNMESLEVMETPLSDDFWEGVTWGAGLVFAGFGVLAVILT